MNQLVPFSYDHLDPETSSLLRDSANEIRTAWRRTAEDIVTIGQRLLQVKGLLPHGLFGAWLEQEFGWSHDSAINFMRVAVRFGNFRKVSEFAPSALYLLAAPSTPDQAVADAMASAKTGERVTYTDAKELVSKYKVPSPKGQPRKQRNGNVRVTIPESVPVLQETSVLTGVIVTEPGLKELPIEEDAFTALTQLVRFTDLNQEQVHQAVSLFQNTDDVARLVDLLDRFIQALRSRYLEVVEVA